MLTQLAVLALFTLCLRLSGFAVCLNLNVARLICPVVVNLLSSVLSHYWIYSCVMKDYYYDALFPQLI